MLAVLCEIKRLLQRSVAAPNNCKLLVLETRTGACSIVALLVSGNPGTSLRLLEHLTHFLACCWQPGAVRTPTVADGTGADAVAPVLLLARQPKSADGRRGTFAMFIRLRDTAGQQCHHTVHAHTAPHLLAVAPVATMMLFARLTVSEPLTTNGRCCRSTDSTSSGSSWEPHRSAWVTQCVHDSASN